MASRSLEASQILDLIENGYLSELEELSDAEDYVNEVPDRLPNIENSVNLGDQIFQFEGLLFDGPAEVEDNGSDLEETAITVVAHTNNVDQFQELTHGLSPSSTQEAPAEDPLPTPAVDQPPAPAQTPGTPFLNIITQKEEVKWKKEIFTTRAPPDWVNGTPCEYQELPSPLTFFEKYVPKSILETARDCTNLYALQNNKVNFKTCSLSEIETNIALHIAMGALKLPRVNMYWHPSLNIGLFTDSQTTLKRFFQIRNNLHFVNNLEIPANVNDVFFKVRPLLDCIKTRCRELEVEQEVSIDEQIIPFTGKLSVKQYVKGKPCPWGIKNFLLSGKSGMTYDFIMYQGEKTELDKDHLKEFGLGAAVVLKLSENLRAGSLLLFDNYFSSYPLLQILKSNLIFAACTARLNRFSKPPLTSDKDMLKKERGYSEEVVSEDGDVVLVKWVDNRSVSFASNFVGIGEGDKVKRWDKKKKAYIQVNRPQVTKEYNSVMGGVDLFNRLLALYRITVRSKKWTLRVIFHAIDMGVTNSWLEYKRAAESLKVPKKEQLDLLNFRLQLAEEMVKVHKPVSSSKRKAGRPSTSSTLNEEPPQEKRSKYEQRPLKTIREDQVDHLPIHDGKNEPTRCKNQKCSSKYRSHFMCQKCKVHLCLNQNRNCFYEFHQ